MYRALYRKYRPQIFEDVVGQEHIVATIKNQILNGKISHAYMFTGTRGTGKTTCAKILARAVNCEHPVNGDPCNECDTCMGILNGSLTDVFEIDAASNNGVDNIRELREDVIFTPALAKYKVYIIDEVHMLSTQAFNALLKTLEEPPEHIIFIFATTEINKVPQTILSRCQRFDFKRITEEDIVSRLMYVAQSEQIQLERDAAFLIARLADGAMRDALSVLDRCINADRTVTLSVVEQTVGICPYSEMSSAIQAIAESNPAAILDFYRACRKNSRDSTAVFSELCAYFRDMVIVKLVDSAADFLSYDGDRLKSIISLAEMFTLEQITRCVSVLQNGIFEMSRYKDKHISAELTLIKLTTPSLGQTLDDLNARVTALENGAVAHNVSASAKHNPPKHAESQPVHAKAAEKADVPKVGAPERSVRSGELFDGLLRELSALGGRSVIPFLSSDSVYTDGNTIYIKCAKDDFAFSVLSTAESVSLIEKAAQNATGKKFALRFSAADTSTVASAPDTQDSLGELLNDAQDILYKE